MEPEHAEAFALMLEDLAKRIREGGVNVLDASQEQKFDRQLVGDRWRFLPTRETTLTVRYWVKQIY